MNNTKKWMRVALVAALAAGLLILLMQLLRDDPIGADGRNGAAAVSTAGQMTGSASPKMGGQSPSAPVTQTNPWTDPLNPFPAEPHTAMASPLSTMSLPTFAADSRGKLVLNSDTHANIEKLLLEENPQRMQATLEKISKDLPPQAVAELRVLVGKFQQYSKALSHSISPENTPDTEREGLKLLDSLHQLRVSYLGPEATQAMFGAEEATSRQLIALMAAEKDPNLTPQQKAERAQEIISKAKQPPPS